MVKLIIFDLDGILVSSKNIHFEALNKALQDFHETPIPYNDHINTFDGKPTKEKLLLLKIPEEKHNIINHKKQLYTMSLLESSIKEDPELIDLFQKLKKENFILHVASNSIKKTIEIVLVKLGIIKYVDFYISNEDVKISKPHPEMYLRCMLQAGIGPKETIIIEDSYVGRKGAFNSGAHVSAIKNKSEVTYTMVKQTINEAEGIKQSWKSNDLNIIIPMAGAGSRFRQAGYTFPKPLIDVGGKPMIQVIVENLNIQAHYIYIVQKEHFNTYNLKPMLELLTPGCDIITVDKLTEGAACTVLLAKDLINNNQPLLIANSDQYIEWDSSHFMYTVQQGNIDGSVPVFYNTHPKWSYAKVDDKGFIEIIKEKEVISSNATVGIYYWKKGSDYVTYAEQMISKNIRVNNEFYVAPTYNEAINDGKKIKVYTIDKMFGLGIPEDLNYFIMSYLKGR
jgi:HAD superfamily hydrolase (TIGR01509 family)